MRAKLSLIIPLLVFYCLPVQSQLGIPLDIEKPEKYDNRVLRSEKSDRGKFRLPSRFIQNTVTHYNYFFNANNKLNEVIARAKSSHKDDFSQLISFYNYSLEKTAQDSIMLDSVIYKSQTGIVLHDLRNDWIDNLYLLWGSAYFLRQQFDSAYLMFQFINYAFAEKEKDGYYRYIGSRMDGNNALSIATREKNSLLKRMLSEPPSRNDAFIWQIRTHIARKEFAEAASLMATLQADPVFPERLHDDLEEVRALWFYEQSAWDSAAVHLELALGNAPTKQEKARWEYLIAQLYEASENYEKAKEFYQEAISHTTDPVMEIYARLNVIRVNKTDGNDGIDENIAELMKMARRDKYRDFRDVIYFMAAQMEMERNNFEAAQALLLQGSSFLQQNELRNQAYRQLAELAFNSRKYRQALSFYDSLQFDSRDDPAIERINERKELLTLLAAQMDVIEKQDSLQRIAALPEDDREEYIRKLLRQLRREQGLDENEGSPATIPVTGTQPSGPFGTQPQQGEWYFYNKTLRARGEAEFNDRWGKRPNTDNWRRAAALAAITEQGRTPRDDSKPDTDPSAEEEKESNELSYEALYNRLPLTEEKLKQSNTLERNALFELGKLYADRLEDCSGTIEVFERIRKDHPDFEQMEETLFRLYYCYNKTGNTMMADSMRMLLQQRYLDGRFTAIAVTGKDPEAIPEINPKATKTYEEIYDLFIEGNFSEAFRKKKTADSLYGSNHWTPQLLYIEAIYYIRQVADSQAVATLRHITTKYPEHALAAKAGTLMEVLSRRKEIEAELRAYKMTGQDSTIAAPADSTTVVSVDDDSEPQADSTSVVVNDNTEIAKDTTVTTDAGTRITFNHDPTQPHAAVMILNKVDIVFARETQNAVFRFNREKYSGQQLKITSRDIGKEYKLLMVENFQTAAEALEYVFQLKTQAPVEVVPWLKPEKYSFTIIDPANLEKMVSPEILQQYQEYIFTLYPDRF